MAMGYAESDDGIHWTEQPDNPILTDDDIPWDEGWQTPFVLFDQGEKIYKRLVCPDRSGDSLPP